MKEKDKEPIIDAGIAGASAEVVSRYGSAVKEHSVAFCPWIFLLRDGWNTMMRWSNALCTAT